MPDDDTDATSGAAHVDDSPSEGVNDIDQHFIDVLSEYGQVRAFPLDDARAAAGPGHCRDDAPARGEAGVLV